jgi:hypothetical protein
MELYRDEISIFVLVRDFNLELTSFEADLGINWVNHDVETERRVWKCKIRFKFPPNSSSSHHTNFNIKIKDISTFSPSLARGIANFNVCGIAGIDFDE